MSGALSHGSKKDSGFPSQWRKPAQTQNGKVYVSVSGRRSCKVGQEVSGPGCYRRNPLRLSPSGAVASPGAETALCTDPGFWRTSPGAQQPMRARVLPSHKTGVKLEKYGASCHPASWIERGEWGTSVIFPLGTGRAHQAVTRVAAPHPTESCL